MPDPLPEHVWEITVQVDNGDWHWQRTTPSAPCMFALAVRAALVFEQLFHDRGGRLVSIANVDQVLEYTGPSHIRRPEPLDDGPSEQQKLHRAGYPITPKEIDTSDIPEAGKEGFEKAKLRLPDAPSDVARFGGSLLREIALAFSNLLICYQSRMDPLVAPRGRPGRAETEIYAEAKRIVELLKPYLPE